MITVRYVFNMISALILIYILLDSRYDKKKTLIILLSGWIGIMLINFIFIFFLGYDIFYDYYPLLVHVPSFFLFNIISKQRGLKALFTLLTVIIFSIIISICGAIFSSFKDSSITLEVVGRIVTFIFIFVLIKAYFRDLYLNMLNTLNKGWGLFCIIPFCGYAIFYYIFMMNALGYSREWLVIMILSVIAVIATYLITMNFFRMFQEQQQQAIKQQQFNYHLEAVKHQYAAVEKAERKMEILRHDTRHFIENISSLIKSGDVSAALDFIGKKDSDYKKIIIEKYCENSTINAILTHYFALIKNDCISLKHKLYIPTQIDIEEMDLANVFANALENARNAVKKLSEERRHIDIVCLYKPKFVIEISNTFDGKILLDKYGAPFSDIKDHGIGTQSIKAFADKYNAVLDYKIVEDCFSLRILIPASADNVDNS
ncbi:MAG: GHKL domain-containing protein [Clostridia bacterium]|nr:GHKL domain-containing protein [Clostridia bacterium]